MTEDRRTVTQRAFGRSPAARHAPVEKFIGSWFVVPHGDAENGAESRGVEDDERPVFRAEHHVVRVLVLNDDVVREQAWRAC
jgi:hypothetical protein